MYWALPNLVVLPAVLDACGTAHTLFCPVLCPVPSHLTNLVVPQSGIAGYLRTPNPNTLLFTLARVLLSICDWQT